MKLLLTLTRDSVIVGTLRLPKTQNEFKRYIEEFTTAHGGAAWGATKITSCMDDSPLFTFYGQRLSTLVQKFFYNEDNGYRNRDLRDLLKLINHTVEALLEIYPSAVKKEVLLYGLDLEDGALNIPIVFMTKAGATKAVIKA